MTETNKNVVTDASEMTKTPAQVSVWDGSEWLEIGNQKTINTINNNVQTAQKTADGKNSITWGTTAPDTAIENDIWLKEDSNGNYSIQVYNGSDWESPTDANIEDVKKIVSNLPQNYYSATEPTGTDYVDGDKWYKTTTTDGTTTYTIYKWNTSTKTWDLMLSKGEIENSQNLDEAKAEYEKKIAEVEADISDTQKSITDTQSDLDQSKKDNAALIADVKADYATQSDELKTIKKNADEALSKANGNSNSISTISTDIDEVNASLTSKASKSDVDAINKTVSTQQTEINQNTNGLSLKASQSSVDTLNQTVSNQTSQLSVLTNQMTQKTAKTDFDTLTGRVSSAEQKIQANSDGITSTVSKVSGLQDQVDNSAVGTNLLLNSGYFETNWGFSVQPTLDKTVMPTIWHYPSTTLSSGNSIIMEQQGISTLESSTYYTASFYAKGSGTISFYCYPNVGSPDGTISGDNWHQIVLTSDYTRYVVTFKTISSISGAKRFLIRQDYNSAYPTAEAYIYAPKLEKGSVATDYSANPADNATTTSVVKVQQTADKLQADLANSDGNIAQLQARADGFDSKFSDTNGKINTLQATSDGYKVSISNIQDQVNNSAVGTNLLTGTSETFVQDSAGYDTTIGAYGDLLKAFSNGGLGTVLTIGQQYTLSFDYSIENFDNSKVSSGIGFGLGTASNMIDYQADTYVTFNEYSSSKGTVKFTFEAENSGDNKYLAFRSMRWKDGVSFTSTDTDRPIIHISNLKLEKGSVATDYSLAPSEQATQSYVTTNINTKADSITASLKSYTDTQSSTAQNNAISTAKTYADTQITAKAGEINLSVSNIQSNALYKNVDYAGVKIDATSGITSTAGTTTLKLNNQNGLQIQKSGSDIFHVDTAGNLTMQGDLTGGNISGVNFTGNNLTLAGTLSVTGSISADSGNVVINDNGISIKGANLNIADSDGNTTTYIKSDGTLVTNKGVFSGDITSSNATITGGSLKVGSNFSVDTSGNLTATNGVFTGTITGSTITGGTISGAKITTSIDDAGYSINLSGTQIYNDANSITFTANSRAEMSGLILKSNYDINLIASRGIGLKCTGGDAMLESATANVGLKGGILYWDHEDGTRYLYADSSQAHFMTDTLQGGGVILRNGNNIAATNDQNFYIDGQSNGGGSAILHVQSLSQSSLLSKKTNISKVDPEKAMDMINSTDIYSYQYKNDVDRDGKKYYASYIIDDVNKAKEYHEPSEFLSEDSTGRDDGSQLAYLTSAVQYLAQEVARLKGEVLKPFNPTITVKDGIVTITAE